MTTVVPAYIARTQLGSLLKPTAVLLNAQEFDDILEELDPLFQKSLRVAQKEHRSGKSITLKEYLKERLARRAG